MFSVWSYSQVLHCCKKTIILYASSAEEWLPAASSAEHFFVVMVLMVAQPCVNEAKPIHKGRCCDAIAGNLICDGQE